MKMAPPPDEATGGTEAEAEFTAAGVEIFSSDAGSGAARASANTRAVAAVSAARICCGEREEGGIVAAAAAAARGGGCGGRGRPAAAAMAPPGSATRGQAHGAAAPPGGRPIAAATKASPAVVIVGASEAADCLLMFCLLTAAFPAMMDLRFDLFKAACLAAETTATPSDTARCCLLPLARLSSVNFVSAVFDRDDGPTSRAFFVTSASSVLRVSWKDYENKEDNCGGSQCA